jgi:hypothetical protein
VTRVDTDLRVKTQRAHRFAINVSGLQFFDRATG